MIPTEPGIVADLPNDDYHADQRWLSSSRLKGYLPERYKAGGSQDALDFGTLFHTVVLEPDNLGGYVVLDAAAIAGNNPKTGKPYDSPTMTSKWKTVVAEAEQGGKTVVAQADWDRAHAMRDAVAKHDTAARLLFEDGQSELSAFATDADGVAHKARFDRYLPGAIVDLKSTSGKPGKDSIARSVVDYGYDLSAAHYLAVADLLGLDVQAFAFVFCTKDEPYRVTVCDLDESFLARGRALRERAIRRHLDPAEPRYEGASGFLTIDAPPWALRGIA
jgi:hypothetical protein